MAGNYDDTAFNRDSLFRSKLDRVRTSAEQVTKPQTFVHQRILPQEPGAPARAVQPEPAQATAVPAQPAAAPA